MSDAPSAENIRRIESNARNGSLTARKLERLVTSDLQLQPFLEQSLPMIVDMFRAEAGVIWLRPQATNGAWFALRHRMDQIHMPVSEQRKHDRLVQFAWQQRQPLLVEPQDRRKGQPDNPTSHALLFGPIAHWAQTVALIELLFPKAMLQASADVRKSYLRSLQWVGDQIYVGLKRRMNLPTATIDQAATHLDQLKEEITSYELSIRRSIEARLQQFHGWTFGSLAENQQFAKMVHELLDQHGLRTRCPECGNASILRCLRAGNSKNGVFVFDHYLETGRTFHGGPTTVPLIHVIGKPLRRPNLAASS